MFGFGKKKQSDPATFMRDVLLELEKDGFQPLWLEELLPDPSHMKVGRVFSLLHRQGLSAKGAALTIELATQFFNQNEKQAEEAGWPLEHTDSVPDGYSRREAYFLEHIADAVMAVKQREK